MHSSSLKPRASFHASASTLVAVLACMAAALPAAVAQDQTWYQLGGSFVGAGDHWGESAALLPDVNFDGHADMLIGAPQDGGEGSAYLISGKAPLIIVLKP